VTVFDQLAPAYAELWSEAPEGRRQRQQVWREIDGLFHRGQRVLDLGCGTGDDALHLASRGVEVLGIDASPAMVKAARDRGVAARELAIESMDTLSGVFDGALSNFGAFNCVGDVRRAALELARLLRPGGYAAICVLSRFWWRESVRFLAAGDLRRAARRWRGRTMWNGLTVHYRTVRQWEAVFAPQFVLARSVPIGGGDHRLLVFRRTA
jgi:SAM-dependent methyltransferase